MSDEPPEGALPPEGATLFSVMRSRHPLSPLELDAYATQLAANATNLEAEAAAALVAEAAVQAGDAISASLDAALSTRLALEAAEARRLAAVITAEYGSSAYSGKRQPYTQSSGDGRWDVGWLEVDGVTFTAEYRTPLGGYARVLAYQWPTAENGMADRRRTLGVTIGMPPEQHSG